MFYLYYRRPKIANSMLTINSSSQSAEIDATMNSSLPLVKYGLPNGGYCSSTSDLCQEISGLPCYDQALIRIFSLIKKRMKMKLRSITSTPTAQADNGEAHNKVRYKTIDYNLMLKYLSSYKSLTSATDMTLRAWYLISPQLIVLQCPLLAPTPLCDRILQFSSKNRIRTKIVIIGAGIAGLAAALMLTQAGILDFQVLEAQSVAGGRISSYRFKEGYVELGAHWVHGSNSTFYEFVRKKRLLSSVVSLEGEGHFFRKNGEQIQDTLVNEVRKVVENILSHCEDFYCKSRKSAPETVGEYLKVEFERYLQSCVGDSTATLKLKRELFDWHLRFQIIDNSCYTLEDLCAVDWGRFQSYGNENFNIKCNYFQVVNQLLDALPDNSVEYEKLVNSVDWNSIIRLSCCSPTGGVHEYLAEHLIVTCSVGVINALPPSFFSPRLPEVYTKGFRSIGFGTINKIFLHFEEAWWRDMIGIQLVWDSVKDNLPEDQQLNMVWTRGVTGFDLVADLPTVLLCWVGGIGAELVEHLSDEMVAEHCRTLLTWFTGTDVPLPTEICPLSIDRSKWKSNEQVRGSYSYFQAGGDQTYADLSAHLLTPIYTENNGRKIPAVLFAGEALHERHFSTVHGAFETGLIQANKLINFLKTN
ncbi:peroxisomal N(1)-acetyl-spermine/spermidine oxidase-like isoform X2 [Rhodnius prolixus]|uniref:peroxisomal N(1)-acetyl-spermine/spermidine oxidase-like isoform X2 n=1 Tax=Rhodnius prolixus TaxID=13249 RepID=UPI003D18985F